MWVSDIERSDDSNQGLLAVAALPWLAPVVSWRPR